VFRAILYLIVFIVAVSVIRSVLGIVGNLLGGLFGTAPPPAQASRAGGPGAASASSPNMETLHKDPVCGTFVAPSTAWQKVSGGKTYYFCSTHCRDQFKG
jgi:YHS domain-containing protein